MNLISSLVLTLLLFGCGQDPIFQRFDDYVKPATTVMNYPIKAIERTNAQVDILWVIDNSYSMDTIQNNVITNTGIFMQEFDKKGGIDWKMGLISTDIDEAAYLGLTTRSGFNHRSSDRVSTFTDAVRRLGLLGDTTERTFRPIMKHLGSSNVFIRENAMFVIINVTDAFEQSANISVDRFMDFLANTKGGDLNKVKYYGVYSAPDIGCRTSDTRWNYSTSKYKQVIDATGGTYFPACSSDFGRKLTGIDKEIISYLQSSKITLKKRPKPRTISVAYKGKILPGGPQDQGGMWYYDFNDNAIVFYNLDFAPGTEEIVDISFDEDDGF
jgi:hypothetical protein